MTSPGQVPVPQQKKAPSCWLIGGLGCLGIIVIGGAVIGFFAYGVSQSARGKALGSIIQSVQHTVQYQVAAEKDLEDIQAALVRYHEAKKHYPKSLRELVPTYLADPSELHNGLDPNPDPNHISFTYVKIPPHAPLSTKAANITWNTNMNAMGQQMDSETIISVSLDGQLVEAMFQNGKLIMRQDLPTPGSAPSGQP